MSNVRVAIFVRQNESDCLNTTVHTNHPENNDGVVYVTKGTDSTHVQITLLRGKPHTKYEFYLKCVEPLGSLTTGPDGIGSGEATFANSKVKNEFAFDMYPGGAPLGDKFQSTTVKF